MWGQRRMNDDSEQSTHNPLANYPGSGCCIVAGILIGIVVWQFVLEEWLALDPVRRWVVQGGFFAACILVASVVACLTQPKGWPWRHHVKSTIELVVVVIGGWGIAAIGHAVGGKEWAAGLWVLGLLLFSLAASLMRRVARREKAASGNLKSDGNSTQP